MTVEARKAEEQAMPDSRAVTVWYERMLNGSIPGLSPEVLHTIASGYASHLASIHDQSLSHISSKGPKGDKGEGMQVFSLVEKLIVDETRRLESVRPQISALDREFKTICAGLDRDYEKLEEIREKIRGVSDCDYKKYRKALRALFEKRKAAASQLLQISIERFNLLEPRYRQRHKFIDDDHIDLKAELDWDNLKPDRNKYRIRFVDIDERPSTKIHVGTAKVSLEDEYETSIMEAWSEENPPKETSQAPQRQAGKRHVYPSSGGLTLEEFHRFWLPSLTLKSIRGDDLLEQIMVCLTMKKALNGDKDSAQRLIHSLCSKLRWKNIHLRVMKRLGGKLHRELKKHYSEDYIKDKIPTWIEDRDQEEIMIKTLEIVQSLIFGFQPSEIMNLLLARNTEKGLVRPPKDLWKWYEYYLMPFQPLSSRLRIAGIEVERDIAPNPYLPMNAEGSLSPTGLVFAKRSLNNNSFIPGRRYRLGPKANLYDLLFHVTHGHVYQLLADFYWPFVRDRHPALQRFLRKTRSAGFTRSMVLTSESILALSEEMSRHGVSRKDAEIYLRVEAKEKKAAIARSLGVSRPTLYKELRRIKKLTTFPLALKAALQRTADLQGND